MSQLPQAEITGELALYKTLARNNWYFLKIHNTSNQSNEAVWWMTVIIIVNQTR
jgi:hypothetical protein